MIGARCSWLLIANSFYKVHERKQRGVRTGGPSHHVTVESQGVRSQ